MTTQFIRGEIKKALVMLFLMLGAVGVHAQSGMSDSQVMEFIAKEYQKGTSQAQIVTKLMQNGVQIAQIRRVRDQYQRMSKNTSMGATGASGQNGDRSRTNNGQIAPGKDKLTRQQVADQTMQDYNASQTQADLFSSYRVQELRDKDHVTKYDETDPDFILMQQELNGILPGDTARMYEELVEAIKRKKKQVFGRDIFSNENLSFEPNVNVALPKNYRLGPGDNVFIDIYGASQKSIEATVAPDGLLTIEGFGPVQVSGLTVAQANARVKQQLGKRYSSSSIRLSVGQTHTIMVNVMGEVKTPGTYTVSSFATVFNALYLAGGISDLGTLRNIKVYRNNKLISVIDVYDYILNGQQRGNVHLADNDVIVVGAYDCLVNITGKVKRPMYYEMKRNESLASLVRYAGGFAGDAYTKSVRVFRKTGREWSIYNVNEFDMSGFGMSDADSVDVDSVIARYDNMVEVKGAVFRPGQYEVGGDISTVKALLKAAEGVTEEAFTARAVMHRLKADRTLEVVAVDVEGILTGRVADIPLQNGDVLFVPTRTDMQEKRTISIDGEVQYPGTYQYADNETLEDFILQAGGLTMKASTVRVDVNRRIVNPHAVETDSILARTFSFSLKDGFVIDGEPGFVLQPFDQVYVHKSPGYNEQQNVEVSGQVLFEGTYALKTRNARLSDIIKACGGPTNIAYVAGAHLERRTNETERNRMEEIQRMAREQQQKNLLELATRSSNGAGATSVMQQANAVEMQRYNIPDYYPVGIKLDEALRNPGGSADIILRDGDRLVVPEYNGTVKINGAVLHSNTVSYVEGKKISYYIDQAGGFSSDAKKRQTYILYMNGSVAKVGHNAKVEPGCEIFVPTKAQSKLSLAETLSIGSSAASIAAVIATIANLLK